MDLAIERNQMSTVLESRHAIAEVAHAPMLATEWSPTAVRCHMAPATGTLVPRVDPVDVRLVPQLHLDPVQGFSNLDPKCEM
jgi:hypothetical protein